MATSVEWLEASRPRRDGRGSRFLRRERSIGITLEPYFLLVLLVLPFAGSLVSVFFLNTSSRILPSWAAGVTALASLLIVIAAYPAVSAGDAIRFQAEWIPQLGVDFKLRMDGFAWMFAVLITGVGFLVVVYARYYMSEEDPVLLLPARLHGRDARRRHQRQRHSAVGVLGADQHLLLPADQLLA
jgi:hypothetical protein